MKFLFSNKGENRIHKSISHTQHVSCFVVFFSSICRYILPIIVATASYILRAVADFTCSPYSQTCRATSELLSHIYAVVIIFLLIIGATKAQQLKEFFGRFKAAVEIVANGGDGKIKKD